MTKKIFTQPEMMVVNTKRNDIITGSTESVAFGGNYDGESSILAPDRDWDAGY